MAQIDLVESRADDRSDIQFLGRSRLGEFAEQIVIMSNHEKGNSRDDKKTAGGLTHPIGLPETLRSCPDCDLQAMQIFPSRN